MRVKRNGKEQNNLYCFVTKEAAFIYNIHIFIIYFVKWRLKVDGLLYAHNHNERNETCSSLYAKRKVINNCMQTSCWID